MALANHVLHRADRRGRRYLLARDVAFTDHGVKLDVYGPKLPTKNTPTIILWHGGSWQRGYKEDLAFIGGSLAEAGYLCVIPDYRLAPKYPFPAYIQDAAAGFSWVCKHIAEYGGSADNLFLMGHSAGAQIAALLAANPSFLAPHKLTTDTVRGLILLAGPYDFTPRNAIKKVFGNIDLDTAMPGRIFKRHPPKMPILLIHGARDFVVEPDQSKQLARTITEANRIVELHIAPLAEHLLIIAGFAGGLWRHIAPSRKWTVEFIESYRLNQDDVVSS